jgi:hypothetical protein
MLEDSIERVVEVIKADEIGEDENDSVDGDFEGLEEEKPVLVWTYFFVFRPGLQLSWGRTTDCNRNPTA